MDWQSLLDTLEHQASTVDAQGIYNTDLLAKIGQAGGVYSRDTGLLHAVNRMADVSEKCLSMGFNLWCQSTLSWYTSRPNTNHWRDKHAQVASGAILGGTGLSNPFKTLSGLADIKIKGEKCQGGYRVTGKLPWVSNVAYNHRLAIVFENQKGDYVMAVVTLTPAHTKVWKANTFMALEGTGTVAVEFDNTFVANSDVLTHDFKSFAPCIRGGFISLQMGMGLGILRRCAAIVDGAYYHENQHLPVQAETIRTWQAEIYNRLVEKITLVEQNPPHDDHYWKDLLTIRRDLSDYTLQALQATMLHCGSMGYLKDSLANRTLREGYFVAVITPSYKQLQMMINGQGTP